MPTEIRTILSKKILTESSGYLDIGFTHTLNPYSGCAFSCKYCYVREMPIQKFKDIPWGDWVEIKANAAENYSKEITRLRKKGKEVNIFMSSATDPYQPVERKAEVTRTILQEMIECPPDLLQIQTRSPLIERDIDLLIQLKEKCNLLVSMTVETDREDIKRIFAPLAPGIRQRLNALKKIHDAGISTQAALSPLLPFTPEFGKLLQGKADRVWIDTLQMGDGANGRRSSRLGMPGLFEEHGLKEWYSQDIHLRAKKYLLAHFPEERILLSRQEAFPHKN